MSPPSARRAASTSPERVAERSARGASVSLPVSALVASGPFGPGLPAGEVAAAIERGLRAGGREFIDTCPLPGTDTASRGGVAQRDFAPLAHRRRREGSAGDLRELLQTLDFDARMRSARALIVAEWRLQRSTLERSPAFELATRARQAGVPSFAITGENGLGAFDARMLDLQLILVAGKQLARLL